jgi:hypothetical protein
LAPNARIIKGVEEPERSRQMTEMPQSSVNAPPAEANDTTGSPPPLFPLEGRIDWSHLGVLPPHKQERRQRYLRARRRGLWQEGI